MAMTVKCAGKLVLIFLLVAFASCGGPGPDREGFGSGKSTDAPKFTFGSELPEEFEVEVTLTSFTDGNVQSTTPHLIARSGKQILLVTNYGKPNERSMLRLSREESYLIDRRARAYVDWTANESEYQSDNEWVHSMVGGILVLFDQEKAHFDKVSSEDGVDQYSVWLPGDEGVQRYIYYDPKLGHTVRQDTTASGDFGDVFVRRNIKRFSLKAGKGRFEIPHHYKKGILKKKQ
ncbi:MAG: hypothetical protein IPM63_16020 [Acidobacteriota bacterium]|nr:MAG: hypothetical protein IPM63_16020 [Acidobacteriota bacterium]